MASFNENDEIPMLPISDSSSRSRAFTSRTRSVSRSNPTSSSDGFDNSDVVLGDTGPLRTQRRPPLVEMSGPLSSTREPEPLFLPHPSSTASSFDPAFHNAPYDDAKGWARRFASSVNRYLPGAVDPRAKEVQIWKKIFGISCLLSIFIDPVFLFLITVEGENKCLTIDWPTTIVLVAVRSVTDVIFCMNILLQFRLAYLAPESTVVDAGQLVSHPNKIACDYFHGKFAHDLFIVMPLPQISIIWMAPKLLGVSGPDFLKSLFKMFLVLGQYIPKLTRILPLLFGQTPTGSIFASDWAYFAINVLTFMLAGHVVGSFWYIFGLQKVSHCLRKACRNSERECRDLIVCGNGNSNTLARAVWRNNTRASACFQEDGFPYGIYLKAVNLTTHFDPVTRYFYSLFWGFQQISTLAGNQVPSYDLIEVLFTMVIIGLGLLLFALLIGHTQNFLQAKFNRMLEKTVRQSDVEQQMSHRRLPEGIRRRADDHEIGQQSFTQIPTPQVHGHMRCSTSGSIPQRANV